MRNDNSQHHQPSTSQPGVTSSIAGRRAILKRIGGASVVAGAASPLSALAGTGRKWCKHPTDSTKCVQASISGAASVLMSAQASDEVKSYKCSHYGSSTNWPSICNNGSTSITCSTMFCTAFKCDYAGLYDSEGRPTRNSNGTRNTDCLFNKSLVTLCSQHAGTKEARWACALANANKLAVANGTSAAFPYTPAQVVALAQDSSKRDAAYAFFTTYTETYS